MTDRTDTPGANRLAQETSPYLLQHQANPVDWYPWGPEAFAKARAEDKPILLSVGYAACHWCHVMAHESFEDPEVARLMNEYFVNIKVDREERPDLDAIYQQALALLGQHGGWPLTMFLTPQGRPFWGGTYFPKADMYGRPGFPRVLEAIAQVYREEPEKVQKNVSALQDALEQLAQPQSAGGIDLGVLDEVAQRLVDNIDRRNGGLGGPPKFPQPGILKLLWRAWRRNQDSTCRDAVTLTLTRMCQGGIYDHLGGGFARYTVDERWLVPHFEKMLYDNAQILELLTWAWQDTGNDLFRERAGETIGWLLREMMAQDDDGTSVGAFAATLDADSEGEEGKFYVWTAEEIDDVLEPDEAALFKRVYDVRPEGNWEGKTILNRLDHPEPLDPAEEALLTECRCRLFQRREHRVRPGWDDKVLADWNGLMIAALAEAAAAFDQPAWLEAARQAFAFVQHRMQVNGRPRHSWRRGRLQHPATLDDHASLIRAAVLLFEHSGEAAYLDQAKEWVAVTDRHFWDAANGGYFTTADDLDDVIVRGKQVHDSAQPSGNGVMLEALARLHYLTGESSYLERAEALIRAFAGELERNFVPLATLLNAVETLHRGLQVVIVGRHGEADTDALLRAVQARCLPERILQVVAPEGALPESHPAAGKKQEDGRATAYVCRGPSCSLPLTSPESLSEALSG